MAAKTATKTTGTLVIPEMDERFAILHVVGTSELIIHKWSEKARKEMYDKQTGAAREKKGPKVPEEDYEGAMYRMPDGTPACKAIAFKAAAVDAAMVVEGMTKAHTRRLFHVLGELLPIEGEPYMREDMVRVGMGIADLRYRPGFPSWKVDVPISYDASVVTLNQIVHLFNKAGYSVGIHEWRPEKDGPYGRFKVDGATDCGKTDPTALATNA